MSQGRSGRLIALAATLALVAGSSAAHADLYSDIGYTQLQAEFAAAHLATPNGAGVRVGQMEAADTHTHTAPAPPTYAFTPNTADPAFSSITFNIEYRPSDGYTDHATTVAHNFYGAYSMASGVTNVDTWSADDWIDHSLNLGTTLAPVAPTPENPVAKVTNHSYKGSAGTYDPEALARLDYVINRDKMIAVVAMDNGSTSAIPPIWGQNYNAISVGLTGGQSSHGYTPAINGAGGGRMKPDIVVPSSTGATSFATPVVASAATVLVGVAQSTPALSDATNPEAIKSILMAGASRIDLPSTWSHTHDHPLDYNYGSGQLNIDRSYHILAAGEQHASGTAVATTGWDYEAATTGTPKTYFFNLTSTNREFAAVLTWNRVITDDAAVAGFNPVGTLANLDLTLSTASGSVVGSLIYSSDSTVDNVEMLYFTNIVAGQYAMQVTSDTAGINYSLAWFSDVPEPGSCMLLAIAGGLAMTRRKRALR